MRLLKKYAKAWEISIGVLACFGIIFKVTQWKRNAELHDLEPNIVIRQTSTDPITVKDDNRLQNLKPDPLAYCRPDPSMPYPPLQPDVVDDFPTVNRGKPRIPHIIHQTYKDENIPDIYWDNIQSVVKHHPSWTYYFWSDASARKLISDRHPYFLKTWDSFDAGIKKGDALRYIVLYEFGGVYLDMDFEILRPLDRTTMKYASIIAPEPFERSVLLFRKEIVIMNCFISSRPKHPFFKRLIEKMAAKRNKGDVLSETGPLFVTAEFLAYNNISKSDIDNKMKSDCSSNSPYFYKGELPEEHDDAVYIPNTYYFNDLNDVAFDLEKKFTKQCSNFENISFQEQRACSDMHRRGFVRKNGTLTFAMHMWTHIWRRDKKFLTDVKRKNLNLLAPDYIIYGGTQ